MHRSESIIQTHPLIQSSLWNQTHIRKGVEANNQHPHLKEKHFCPIEAKKAPGERLQHVQEHLTFCQIGLLHSSTVWQFFSPLSWQFYLVLTSTPLWLSWGPQNPPSKPPSKWRHLDFESGLGPLVSHFRGMKLAGNDRDVHLLKLPVWGLLQRYPEYVEFAFTRGLCM